MQLFKLFTGGILKFYHICFKQESQLVRMNEQVQWINVHQNSRAMMKDQKSLLYKN